MVVVTDICAVFVARDPLPTLIVILEGNVIMYFEGSDSDATFRTYSGRLSCPPGSVLEVVAGGSVNVAVTGWNFAADG